MRRHPVTLALQVQQTHAVEVFVVAYSLGWPKGPLASTPRVLRKTFADVGIDLPKPFAGVSVAKVVCPTSEVTVQLFDELGQRHKTALRTDNLSQLLSLPLQSLLGYRHVEIPVVLASQIAVIAKHVPQEVELLSWLLQINHPRFVPVDLKPHPVFQLRFDPPAKLVSLIARQHHKIIGIADKLGTCPTRWTRWPMKHLVEPVKIQVREQRRTDSTHAIANLEFERVVSYQRS
jgi:hypothetical protein